ncbi:hypothetical protein D9M72_410980 [compost metagenome]
MPVVVTSKSCVFEALTDNRAALSTTVPSSRRACTRLVSLMTMTDAPRPTNPPWKATVVTSTSSSSSASTLIWLPALRLPPAFALTCPETLSTVTAAPAPTRPAAALPIRRSTFMFWRETTRMSWPASTSAPASIVAVVPCSSFVGINAASRSAPEKNDGSFSRSDAPCMLSLTRESAVREFPSPLKPVIWPVSSPTPPSVFSPASAAALSPPPVVASPDVPSFSLA